MKLVTGNTFPVKDQLKALGARWNAEQKGWMVPDDQFGTALKIVAGGGCAAPSDRSSRRHYSRCHECGAPSHGYYRCRDCSLDYREGGGMYNGGQSYRDSRGNFVLGDDD